MNITLPLLVLDERIPVGEVTEFPLMSIELAEAQTAFDARCLPCWKKGVAGMDEMCNLGRPCK